MLGIEVTPLISDLPGIAANTVQDTPALVEPRRAVIPSLVPRAADLGSLAVTSVNDLRGQIANGWSVCHAADFDSLMPGLPGVIADAGCSLPWAVPPHPGLRQDQGA
jgi:hypothetical protein